VSNYPQTDYEWLAKWAPRVLWAAVLAIPVLFFLVSLLPFNVVAAIAIVYYLSRKP
jgi:hypothetical protein